MYKNIVSFIRQTFKSPVAFLPLHEPKFIGNEREYVIDAIDSTFVSATGKYVNLFEKKMCEITGAKYAIATVNGTNALHLALILAGVKNGDEVLTQPLTFIATANAIKYANATPHFVDVDKDTMGLSPVKLDNYLSEIIEIKNNQAYNKKTGKRISACLPMHTFGLPLRIDELIKVCEKHHIAVVEDAAESLGSYYKNKHTGTFGLLGTFSFNGNKTVTAGGGGCIVTNDEQLAHKAKHLSTQAKIPHQWEYAHDAVGYNYRMPNLNAALACAQLEQLEFYVENKRELSDLYFDFFKDIEDITLAREIKGAKANYWLNAIILKDREARDKFLEYTNSAHVMTRPIWKLMTKLDMFEHCPKSNLSNAEWLENRVVNITSSVRV